MTAEIAIMNKSAVALAADSAVTVRRIGPRGHEQKIFNTANKLFTLSKYAPIGVMIYGNSNVMDIPWETIIKIYRRELGEEKLPRVQDYCSHFFNFLDRFKVGNKAEIQYLMQNAYNVYSSIRYTHDEWAKQRLKDNGITSGEIEEDLERSIFECSQSFNKLGDASDYTKEHRVQLVNKHRDNLNQFIDNVFEELPVSSESREQLQCIAVNAACAGPPDQSGIVIAGFGEVEYFPSCYSYDVAGIFGEKTVKRDDEKNVISHENTATIKPFAQSKEVCAFIEGIAPDLQSYIKESFEEILTDNLPKKLCEYMSHHAEIDSEQQGALSTIVKDICQGAFEQVFLLFDKAKSEKYVWPVIEVTAHLSKDELAQMAETLVNLESFRKQVAMEEETVGGPIDVAVITKGDGLIWVKRKHYFEASLNHHFFRNYFETQGEKNDFGPE